MICFFQKQKQERVIVNVEHKGEVDIRKELRDLPKFVKYFNKQFENILFNKNFFDIFELKKIRNFILEIS